MTNKQFDYVEEQAKVRHISFKICPTCGGHPKEEAPGIFTWPKTATYKLDGEEHACDCEEQIELMRHYLLADIPKDYWRLSEADWWGDPAALRAVQDYVVHWPAYKQMGIGLKIYSPRLGVGKTFLATMLARGLIQRGESVVFISFREAIRLYDFPYEVREEKLSRLRSTPILILDEVGSGLSEAQRAYMAQELEDLLRFRTGGNTNTIITTNMTPDELDDEYPRCFSLLAAKQEEIYVGGNDVRKNGDKKLLDLELAKAGEIRPIC